MLEGDLLHREEKSSKAFGRARQLPSFVSGKASRLEFCCLCQKGNIRAPQIYFFLASD